MSSQSDHDRLELIKLLSETIGEDTARRVVYEATETLRIEAGRFSREQAFAALERIAGEPGLVGITARLAKTRLRARTMNAPQRTI